MCTYILNSIKISLFVPRLTRKRWFKWIGKCVKKYIRVSIFFLHTVKKRMDPKEMLRIGLKEKGLLERFSDLVFRSQASKKDELKTIEDKDERLRFKRLCKLCDVDRKAYAAELIRKSGKNKRVQHILDKYVFKSLNAEEGREEADDPHTVWFNEDGISIGTDQMSSSYVSDGWSA